MRDGKIVLVYIDEAHIQLDADQGYIWSLCGEPAYVGSTSPGLAKVSFYGLYLCNLEQVRILPHTCGNGENTIDVLKWLHEQFPDREVMVVWDGASYHRAGIVKEQAKALGITIEPLPGYSPDFMPVEALWRWLREEVTYNHCHPTGADLIARVAEFEHRINKNSKALADRLRVKEKLDPKEEALRLAQWTLAQQQKLAQVDQDRSKSAESKRTESKRAAESAALVRAITAWKGSPPTVTEPRKPKKRATVVAATA